MSDAPQPRSSQSDGSAAVEALSIREGAWGPVATGVVRTVASVTSAPAASAVSNEVQAEALRDTTRKSPPSEPPNAEDVLFVNHLSAADLLGGLGQRELRRLGEHLEGRGVERRTSLLEHYYEADGDPTAAAARRADDRFFSASRAEDVTAQDLVARLAAVNPEIEDVTLERIGPVDGPLVLRSGEHVAAIDDDEEDEEEDDDATEVGASTRAAEDGRPTIRVRSLVQAANRLLQRADVRDRMVALSSEADREVYVGLSLQSALALVREDLLDDEDPEAVMEFAGW